MKAGRRRDIQAVRTLDSRDHTVPPAVQYFDAHRPRRTPRSQLPSAPWPREPTQRRHPGHWRGRSDRDGRSVCRRGLSSLAGRRLCRPAWHEIQSTLVKERMPKQLCSAEQDRLLDCFRRPCTEAFISSAALVRVFEYQRRLPQGGWFANCSRSPQNSMLGVRRARA